MKKLIPLICCIAIFACGFGAGYLAFHNDPTPPVIKQVVKYETRYLKPPTTDCERAPIELTHRTDGFWLHTTATDGCKTTADKVLQECPGDEFNVKSHGVAAGAGALAAFVLMLIF